MPSLFRSDLGGGLRKAGDEDWIPDQVRDDEGGVMPDPGISVGPG